MLNEKYWKKKLLFKNICAGMHPGGGFVALPGNRSTRLGEMKWESTHSIPIKGGRRGYVALPGKP